MMSLLTRDQFLERMVLFFPLQQSTTVTLPDHSYTVSDETGRFYI